jgi:serine/threonine-protein kinase
MIINQLQTILAVHLRVLTVGSLLGAAAVVVGSMLAELAPATTSVHAAFDVFARFGTTAWLAVATAIAIYGRRCVPASRRETAQARSLGPYTLGEKLGQGGMGEVYLAEHRLLKRTCAVKLIRPENSGDAKAITRFQAEVQATARLNHPNTIGIFDYGISEDGTYFYAMEYLSGMNLEEIVSRFGPLPPTRAVHLLRQVCGALAEAHAAGLVHRDIKPGNIFAVEREGHFDLAKLLDFGLVRTVADDVPSPSVTADGLFVGSPLYAPPECTLGSGELDGRSDIYSLGATAYHLLTGRPVFKDDNPLRLVLKHAHEEPVAPRAIRADIPAELERIVMKCLAKQPEERFQDVAALGDALSRIELDGRWTQKDAAAWWEAHRDLPAAAYIEQADTTAHIEVAIN